MDSRPEHIREVCDASLKRVGIEITSEKEDDRGQVYRLQIRPSFPASHEAEMAAMAIRAMIISHQ